VCAHFEWKRIYASFSLFDYICIAIGDPVIKRDRVEISLIGLTLPYCCAYPKSGPGFQLAYVMVFSLLNDLR